LADRTRGRLTEVRPATEVDAELLARWHGDPEVARYWDGKIYTVEQVRARLARPDVDAYIVEADGAPIGYLQAWREEGACGLDMFLIPSARGRGYGPDAARALGERLVDQGWHGLIVDPYLSNERAIAAWRRAGFEPVEERPADDEHTAPWLLMEFRPTPS
jgi:aminoglycoside 6'-N-acetyltransferase